MSWILCIEAPGIYGEYGCSRTHCRQCRGRRWFSVRHPMRWCIFTNELTYLVLITSLGIAVGDVTLVLRPMMYNVQE